MPDSGGSRAQRAHIPTTGTGADDRPVPHGDAGALSVDPAAPQVTAPAGLPGAPDLPGTPGPSGAPGLSGPAARTARRTGLLVTMVLGGLTALPPLSMDMYLPALPAVTDSLSAPAATIQLTLTACLAGMALGQLVVGPMSDRWGRRKPLLLGMVVYVLATAICALAPTAELLIGFRLLQGLAGAAASSSRGPWCAISTTAWRWPGSSPP